MAQRSADPILPRRQRRLALACLACVGATGLPWLRPAGAASWDLEALMRLLATRKSGEARFKETKTLSMLNAPIESSGILRFAAPDFLEMHTLAPKPQKVVVQGRQVTVELDGKTHRFDLDQTAEAGALVDGIRATLDGDLAGLRRNYAARLRGSARLWTLELVPRLDAARARISEIDVSGSGSAVLSIAVFQADGDRSLMTLHELRTP